MIQDVPITSIRLDGATQMRANFDEGTAKEYGEDNGAMPPVILFEEGQSLWIGDGWHRIIGRQMAGGATVLAEVRPGTLRDAQLFAAGANAAHGLRRTAADKKHAVETLLADPEWAERSDRWIAETCKVSNHFVSKIRAAKQPKADPGGNVPTRDDGPGGFESTCANSGGNESSSNDGSTGFESSCDDDECSDSTGNVPSYTRIPDESTGNESSSTGLEASGGQW